MSKNNLNDHTSQSLRESILKVLEEGPTSQRNLEQFRERQNQEREAMRARGQEINAARRERNAQISAETAKHSGSREAAMDTLNKSVEFQRLSATANRGQGQQNTIGGEQQRTEGQSPAKGFGVGRGFGGKPVITGGSYVNPNTTPKIEEPLQNTSTPDASTALAAARAKTQQDLAAARNLANTNPSQFNAQYPAATPGGRDIISSNRPTPSNIPRPATTPFTDIPRLLQRNDTQIKIPTSQRTIPNTPQNPSDTRNDVSNFNNTPMPVKPEVIPERNPKSSNMMRNFDLYGP